MCSKRIISFFTSIGPRSRTSHFKVISIDIPYSQKFYLQLPRRLSQRWYIMKVPKSSNYNTQSSKGKCVTKAAVFFPKKSSNYNTLLFQRKRCHESCCLHCPENCPTMIHYFSKGKGVMNSAVVFLPKKSSNYNTLLLQREICHESCCFFLAQKMIKL